MRRALVGALVLCALTVRAPFAWGCSCVERATAQQFAAASAVFVGRVAATESRADEVAATIDVLAIYKGAVGRVATVLTAPTPSACGVEFVPGTRYAIFARAARSELRADLCGGTSADLAVLRRARITATIPPVASTPPIAVVPTARGGGARPVLLVVAAALLAGVAASLARARGGSLRR